MKVKITMKILFVCYGNVCRSSFAHYYLSSLALPNIEVASCGYYPVKGRRCPSEAIEAGERIGVDLRDHRSMVITNKMIQDANTIFTFDEDNFYTVTKEFPSAKSKIFRISSLNTNAPVEINDPYCNDVDYFYTIYVQIKSLLDDFAINICKNKSVAEVI